MERTFVIVKPDAVADGHVGAILERYEAAQLTIEAMELREITGDFADRHYAGHVGKDYYPALREFMTEGPLVALVLSGEDAIARVRKLNGATDPAKAEAGTIRADFATTLRRNAVHASDSAETAASEVSLWFPNV